MRPLTYKQAVNGAWALLDEWKDKPRPLSKRDADMLEIAEGVLELFYDRARFKARLAQAAKELT